jgi:hypothetical protein
MSQDVALQTRVHVRSTRCDRVWCGADHSRTSETLLANLPSRMDGFRGAETGLGRGNPGRVEGADAMCAPKIRDGHARRMGNA